jgi:hemerythrin
MEKMKKFSILTAGIIFGAVFFIEILFYFLKFNSLIGAIIQSFLISIVIIMLSYFRNSKESIIFNEIVNIFGEISKGEGKLNRRLDEKNAGRYKELVTEINIFMEEFEQIVMQVNITSEKVADASKTLSNDIENVVRGVGGNDKNIKMLMKKTIIVVENVTNQYASTQEVAAAITELSNSFTAVADNAEETMRYSEETTNYARIVEEAVEDNLQEMKKIQSVIKIVEEKSIKLEESSREIVNIVSMINKISQQTNLLSLNAAIEAARAGEAGKGFAVVADEVRKLADSSKEATNEIESLIDVIRTEITDVITNIRTAYEEVKHGSELSKNAGEKTKDIMRKIEDTTAEVGKITVAIQEQSTAIDDINMASESITTNSERINEITTEQAESLEEISNILENVMVFSGNLTEVSNALKNVVRGFSVDTSKGLKDKDFIEWNNKYETGVAVFDNEHKKLVAIINRLNRAMMAGEGSRVVKGIISELIDYTATHFKHEETEMVKHGYGKYDEHKGIHIDFVNQVLKVQKDVESGRVTVSTDLMEFLKDWLLKHIMVSDKEYFPFFNSKGLR